MTPEQLLYEAKCLRAENAQLTAEANALRRETTQLRAELTEARKQPVRLLPEIGFLMAGEYFRGDYAPNTQGLAEAMNTIIRRHFRRVSRREAAEARVKPTLDVGAVIDDLWRELYGYYVTKPQFLCQIEEVIRRHVTDAPAQPLQETQQLPDETLAAAVKRVERETRRECAAKVREWGQTPFVPYESLADRMERGE